MKTFAGRTLAQIDKEIAEMRKEFFALSPEEQKRVADNPVYDRWQAEQDAMADDAGNE
jgi:hypothetical protein